MRALRGAFAQSPARLAWLGHFHDQFALLRLDHQLRSSHAMTLRLNANRDVNDNPNDRVSGFVQPGAATASRSQATGPAACHSAPKLQISCRFTTVLRAAAGGRHRQ